MALTKPRVTKSSHVYFEVEYLLREITNCFFNESPIRITGEWCTSIAKHGRVGYQERLTISEIAIAVDI